MVYSTRTYQIETPDPLWEAFKQIHTDRDRLNSRVIELIAEDVDQCRDELNDEVAAELDRILTDGGLTDGV